MELLFLGTSAGIPTKTRNMTAIALKLRASKQWLLFDCAEGTQHTIHKSDLNISALSHIFITHLHGDHVYGLPGLLSSRSMGGLTHPLVIYGPVGIREWIETTMRLSQLTLSYPLEICEYESEHETICIQSLRLRTHPMIHTMPTFGFIIQEADRPGHLDVTRLQAMGIESGPLYGKIKNGETVTLSDGRGIDGREFVGPEIPGKKIIIAGDNADPEIFGPHLEQVDLFVHEATFTQHCFDNHGKELLHSTSKMVAQAAEKAGVKTLALTHFSPRHTAQKGEEGMGALEAEARAYYSGELILAEDLLRIKL